MEHTDKDQGEQDWTTNKKRRRGVEEDMDQDVEVSATCRKFGIILGAFRTEVEVLAELHLMYPWINLTRRTNGAGSAILITKDDRTRTRVVHVPITALFRATVVHIQYVLKKVLFRTRVVHVPITALFRDTVVHIRYVLKKVLFRTRVVHVPITALFRATVVHSP